MSNRPSDETSGMTMQPEGTERYHVPNLERALVILEHLARYPEGLGLSEIAEQLSLPKNSVFRIVSTLCAYEYLVRDEISKRVKLTRKLFLLGSSVLDGNHLLESSLDVLRTVRDLTGETALIGVLAGTKGTVLEQIPSHQPLKFLVDPGTCFPLHTSAPGKVFLAFLPQDEAMQVISHLTLTRYTNNTITAVPALRAELQQVRTQGFGLDMGEEIEGLNCVGAPIFNHQGYPIAAIWVTGPSFRLTQERIEGIAGVVCQNALIISKRFGYALLR